MKVYRKTYMVMCGLMLLISTILISTAVEITPEIIDIELVGGNFTSKEIIISNTESYPIDCKISTVILPDGDGINVTYSKSTFTIQPYAAYSLKMRINTSINLEPNFYTIKTKLEFINQDKTSVGSSDDSFGNSPIFRYVTASDDDDEKEIPTDANETSPDKNETILDYDNDDVIISSPSYPLLCFVLTIFIIISSIVFITLLYVIKKKNKMEKKKK